METIKNTFNAAAETIQGAGATASKEANKEVAKDSNAGIGTRASAAKDALGDKMDEQSHDAKSTGYKEAAKH